MKKILLILLILGLVVSGKLIFDAAQSPREPWKPVMEESGFEYLDEQVDKAIKHLNDAIEKNNRGQCQKEGEYLQIVLNSLLELKSYYIPMTNIRQLIYDADRLYYLQEVEKAKDKLQRARELLLKMDDSLSNKAAKPVTEAMFMLEELILAIDFSPEKVSEKFNELGHRVNMMVLKGALIINEADLKKSKH